MLTSRITLTLGFSILAILAVGVLLFLVTAN